MTIVNFFLTILSILLAIILFKIDSSSSRRFESRVLIMLEECLDQQTESTYDSAIRVGEKTIEPRQVLISPSNDYNTLSNVDTIGSVASERLVLLREIREGLSEVDDGMNKTMKDLQEIVDITQKMLEAIE